MMHQVSKSKPQKQKRRPACKQFPVYMLDAFVHIRGSAIASFNVLLC
ncbi:hypothetical protein MPQ_0373 [Methylovorus sp. MP688]|nr:hypothetical protein MPQ_0373 [Methylovorus sp. MP688]